MDHSLSEMKSSIRRRDRDEPSQLHDDHHHVQTSAGAYRPRRRQGQPQSLSLVGGQWSARSRKHLLVQVYDFTSISKEPLMFVCLHPSRIVRTLLVETLLLSSFDSSYASLYPSTLSNGIFHPQSFSAQPRREIRTATRGGQDAG